MHIKAKKTGGLTGITYLADLDTATLANAAAVEQIVRTTRSDAAGGGDKQHYIIDVDDGGRRWTIELHGDGDLVRMLNGLVNWQPKVRKCLP